MVMFNKVHAGPRQRYKYRFLPHIRLVRDGKRLELLVVLTRKEGGWRWAYNITGRDYLGYKLMYRTTFWKWVNIPGFGD